LHLVPAKISFARKIAVTKRFLSLRVAST
jgi:hypothetical protein